MKNIFTLLAVICGTFSYAQNIGIGTANPKEKLHVAGGVRIDSLAAGKVKGLILHDSLGSLQSLSLTGNKSDVLRGDGTFYSAASATDAWLLGGNFGTNPDSNFLGTNDESPLMFRVAGKPFGGFSAPTRQFSNMGLGLHATTKGVANIALGEFAMASNVSGNFNIAIGNNVMWGVTKTSNALALGNAAMWDGGGAYSVAVGNGSQYQMHGEDNVALGNSSLAGYQSPEPTIGSKNVAVGNSAMFSANYASENVSMGHRSMEKIRHGSRNVALGFESMKLNVNAYNQVAIGYQSLYNENIDIAYNTAVGYQSMYSNKAGVNNMAIGYQALYNNISGARNTASGFKSMYTNTAGKENAAAGFSSLYFNTTGNYNIANGTYSLYTNTTGASNSALGYFTLFKNATGNCNTAIGALVLSGNTTGTNNTGIGYRSLESNVTGSLNTALGMFADVTAGNFSNATAVGYNAKVNASNKVRIGNAAVTVIEGQVPFTTPSDGRYKFNIEENVKGLDFVMRLRPVTYQFDVQSFDQVKSVAYDEAMLIRRTGFIAQEVEQAASASGYNFSGIIKPRDLSSHYSLSYESFVVPLVKSVQEQQQIILRQEEKIEKQEKMIALLFLRLEALEKKHANKND